VRVTRFEGDKDLDELADRVYTFDAGGDVKTKAARGIARANPHLHLRRGMGLVDAVPPGALIAVPDMPGATPKKTVPRIEDAAVGAILEHLSRNIQAAAGHLDAARERSIRRAAQVSADARSKDLKEAVANDPELQAAVAKAAERAKARLASLKKAAAIQEASLSSAEETMANLLEGIRRRRG
jgi:hypothetical protein